MINCWVPSDRGHDLSAAEQYGRVNFICSEMPNVFAERLLARRVAQCVEESGPEDWLITTGSSPVLALFAAAFMLRWNRLNVLIYDNRTSKYFPWTVRGTQLVITEAPTGDKS